AQRGDLGGAALVEAEGDAEVLVDVGVDGDHRQPAPGEVPDEQRRQGGLAAPALADERNLHISLFSDMKTVTNVVRRVWRRGRGEASGTAGERRKGPARASRHGLPGAPSADGGGRVEPERQLQAVRGEELGVHEQVAGGPVRR